MELELDWKKDLMFFWFTDVDEFIICMYIVQTSFQNGVFGRCVSQKIEGNQSNIFN